MSAFHLYLLPATIIFDMNGVLSYQDKLTICYNAGFYPLTKYIIYNGMYNIRTLFTQTLHTIPYSISIQKMPVPTDDMGKPLPAIMTAWLKGELNGQEVINIIEQFINRNPNLLHYTEQTLVHSFAHALFVPELFAQATHFYDEAVELVQSCKDQGHTLYILSNWDRESFPCVYTKKKELFNLFNDIILSGDINLIKPHSDIYQYIIDRFDLDPVRTAFIDDQYVNVRTAKQCGLFGIHCIPMAHPFCLKPNIARVRTKLDAWLHKIKEPCLCHMYA